MKRLARRFLRSLVGTRRGYFAACRIVASLSWHLDETGRALARRVAPDGVVRGGPFRGLFYPRFESCGSVLVAKLLGSYEVELCGVVEACLAGPYTDVIDIGCAEGYYAVGFARRMPAARVHAFDGDGRAREQCAAMAEANGVADRVRLAGLCTPAALRAVPCRGRALIVSDCEGAEMDLLRPGNLPSTDCDLLVEIHSTPESGGLDELESRFASTHESTRIHQQDRDASQYPPLAGWPRGEQFIALSEHRAHRMTWLFLRRRNG